MQEETIAMARTMRSAAREMRLIRRLEPIAGGARWLALDERDQTNHLLYEFDADDAGDVLESLLVRRRCACAHVMPIEAAWRCEARGATWGASPFVGNQHGLVRLADVVRARGGRLPSAELRRALTQVLRALASLHGAGIAAGGLDRSRLLVDARGAVKLELHGFPDVCLEHDGLPDRAADDVAAAFALGYEMATGQAPSDGRPMVSRLSAGFSPAWDAVFERGLDPLGGFASAADALCAAEDADAGSTSEELSAAGAARVVVRRVRRAVRSASDARRGENRDGRPGAGGSTIRW